MSWTKAGTPAKHKIHLKTVDFIERVKKSGKKGNRVPNLPKEVIQCRRIGGDLSESEKGVINC
jgi:hypothetical protein